MPAGPIPDEQVRELAREILARSAYAEHRRPRTWLQEWVDAVAEVLRRIEGWIPEWLSEAWVGFVAALRGAFDFAFGDDAVVVLLRLALALAVFGAFALLGARLLRELRERRPAPPPGPASSVDDEPRLLAEAESLAREGRFLEAAHCTQLAALQLLLRKRWLELERSDPNRTLRRRLAEARLPEPTRRRFLALLDRLEGLWFRDRVEDAGLYGDWRQLHQSIAALPEAR
jgi:hypothetical protein